ncbi:Guanylate-binding protein 6 [Stylophora pistillata]|uniref:Guanylate-binding protein 6 n=1 Tax=Stylophora pistillata TaxID=50429 RepID=A0A2B4R546_STYPI|nr:Guanylate-binding protein 6 [Stylophora pistillata]
MEQTDHTQQVAECILRFFPGFEAFKLPSPSADEEVMKNINRNRNHINSEFFSEIEKFKVLLKSTLTPKRSFNDGELVTGQGLAALVELYVKAINTPGVIPNIQSAWDTFVTDKCSEATHAAMHVYNAIMHSKLSNQVPCDSEDIRKYHETALDQAIGQLEVETIGISSVTIERYLNELMSLAERDYFKGQTENDQFTREACNALLKQLKKQHLDPILAQLHGKEGAKVTFDDILAGYNKIEQDYEDRATGAKKKLCCCVLRIPSGKNAFYLKLKVRPEMRKMNEFEASSSELMTEMQQYLGVLKQLKDFDENLSREIAAKAYQQQEKIKLEEEYERLQQENRQRQKEVRHFEPVSVSDKLHTYPSLDQRQSNNNELGLMSVKGGSSLTSSSSIPIILIILIILIYPQPNHPSSSPSFLNLPHPPSSSSFLIILIILINPHPPSSSSSFLIILIILPLIILIIPHPHHHPSSSSSFLIILIILTLIILIIPHPHHHPSSSSFLIILILIILIILIVIILIILVIPHHSHHPHHPSLSLSFFIILIIPHHPHHPSLSSSFLIILIIPHHPSLSSSSLIIIIIPYYPHHSSSSSSCLIIIIPHHPHPHHSHYPHRHHSHHPRHSHHFSSSSSFLIILIIPHYPHHPSSSSSFLIILIIPYYPHPHHPSSSSSFLIILIILIIPHHPHHPSSSSSFLIILIIPHHPHHFSSSSSFLIIFITPYHPYHPHHPSSTATSSSSSSHPYPYT